MFHLNPILRDRSLGLWRIVEWYYGIQEMYVATSVQDFLQNQGDVEVCPPSRTIYGEGSALIEFTNVNLSFDMSNYIIASDMTGELRLILDEKLHLSARRENLDEGRYYEIVMLYAKYECLFINMTPHKGCWSCHDNNIVYGQFLYSAMKFGPKELDSASEGLEGILAPAHAGVQI